MSILTRVICLAVGYVFGLFQTGYIFGKLNGIDIRNSGSGNSGTTNALRVMGKKAGVIVLLGDVLKLCLACYVTVQLFNGGIFHQAIGPLVLLYTGFGAVLGHNFPFYLHFKGGKGIACSAAMFLVLDWRLTLIEAVVFVLVVVVTHYVSVGSICVVVAFVILWALFPAIGMPLIGESMFAESMILVVLWALLAIYQHRANIGRLLKGRENKLF